MIDTRVICADTSEIMNMTPFPFRRRQILELTVRFTQLVRRGLSTKAFLKRTLQTTLD